MLEKAKRMSFLKSIFKKEESKKSTQPSSKSRNSVNAKSDYIPDISRTNVPTVEYCFSNDEVGQNLESLWKTYVTIADESIRDSDTKEIPMRQLEAFNLFSDVFVHEHLGIVEQELIRNNYIKSESENSKGKVVLHRADSLSAVKGHPSEVIVMISKLLYDLLTFDRTIVLDTNVSKSVKEQDKYLGSNPVKVLSIFQVCRDNKLVEPTVISTDTNIARESFLNILKCLSILICWKHNKAIIENKLGEEFAMILVGLLKYFTDLIAQLTVSFSCASDLSVEIEKNSNCKYIFSVLIQIVHLLCQSANTFGNVKQICDVGLLPRQPWDERILESMTYIGSIKSTRDVEISANCSTNSCESIFCNAMQPIVTGASGECWSGELIKVGADKELLGLLQLLHSLNNSLKRACDISSTDLKPEHRSVAVCFLSILILQNEVLFSLLCLMTSQPKVSCRRFIICNGIDILNGILLETSVSFPKNHDIFRDLIYQRGMLCLRLNELLVQRYIDEKIIASSFTDINSSGLSMPMESNDKLLQDTILFSESLGWFFSWMRQVYSYDFPSEDCISSTSNHHIGYVNSLTQPIKLLDNLASDLWPWNNIRPSSTISFSKSDSVIGDYRLAHYYSNSKTSPPIPMTSSVGGGGREIANALKTWAVYIEKTSMNYPDPPGEPPVGLPWYLKGKLARVWNVVFSILVSTCTGRYMGNEQSFDIRRQFMKSNYDVLLKAVFSSFDDQGAAANINECPIFHVHFLLYVARCLYRAPANTIDICYQYPEMWSMLFADNFLLSGRKKIDMFLEEYESSNQKIVEDYREDVSSYSNEDIPVNFSATSMNNSKFAFMWFSVHDCSLDLAQALIFSASRPPANKIVKTSQCFEIKPVINGLQVSCEKRYDDITFQLLRWLNWYFVYLSNHNLNLVNAVSYQFVRASLAVCGYHLSSLGITHGYQKKQSDNPFKLEKSRPFMWPTRYTALELITQIANMEACDKWLSLFLFKDDSDGDSPKMSRTPQGHSKFEGLTTQISTPTSRSDSKLSSSKSKNKTPAHTTLMLLFVDERLREIVCSIMLEVFRRCVLISIEGFRDNEQSGSDRTKSVIERTPEGKRQLSNQYSDLDDKKYHNCILNILNDFIEQIKVSSSQPSWMNGVKIVKVLLFQLSKFIRSFRFTPIQMKAVQRLFTWNNLISETTAAIFTCLQNLAVANWNKNESIEVLNLCVALLTAIMADNDVCKDLFKVCLAMRKRSKTNTSTSLEQSSQKSNKVTVINDEFIDLILSVHDSPTLEFVIVLFEFLLDGPFMDAPNILSSSNYKDLVKLGFFQNEYDRPLIRNISAIPVIFGIVPYCEEYLQKCILNCFHMLVMGRGSLENISTCVRMQPSLFDIALDLFMYLKEDIQDVAANLLQALGKHSLSVAQLKRMFQLMQSKGEYRPTYTWLLLDALYGMIEDCDVPRHSFVFNGIESGLNLPRMLRWPAQNAYTFCVWFRIESSVINIQVNREDIWRQSIRMFKEYKPYILSLRCQDSAGVEIYLKNAGTTTNGKFKLYVHYYDSSGANEPFCAQKATITEGHWHFVAITQSSKGFRGTGDLEILVDNKFIRSKLQFPNFSGVIECPIIGDCDRDHHKNMGTSVNTTMRGQVSSIYFFSEALTEGQMRGIYGLGPSYFYAFEPYSIIHRELPAPTSTRKVAVDPILSVLDGSLTQHIMLSYNPAVWQDDLVLDNAPERSNIKWKNTNILSQDDSSPIYKFLSKKKEPEYEEKYRKYQNPSMYSSVGKMHAFCLPGTYRTIMQSFRIALDSLGGLSVLLPLFTQFDQPRQRFIVSPSGSNLKFSSDVDTRFDDKLCLSVLKLLESLLDKPEDNLTFFKDLQGASLLAYFFERISPKHISIAAFDTILKMRSRVYYNRSHSNSIFENILLNFKIWVYTPFEVQDHIIVELEKIIKSEDIKYLRSIEIVNLLLDNLYLLYDYDKLDINSIIIGRLPTSSIDRTSQDISQASLSRRSSDVLKRYSTADIARLNSGLSLSELSSSPYFADVWKQLPTGSVEGVKLKGRELQLIRKKILSILYNLILRGDGDMRPIPDDIAALVEYTVAAPHPRCKIEGFKILLKLLSRTPDDATTVIPRVLIGLSLKKCLLSFFPLLNDKLASVRMYTLIVFCSVIHKASLYPILPLDSSDTFYLSTPSDTFSLLSLQVTSLDGVFCWMLERLLKSITEYHTDSYTEKVQYKMIAQALQSTMLGESCAALSLDVDQQLHDLAVEPTFAATSPATTENNGANAIPNTPTKDLNALIDPLDVPLVSPHLENSPNPNRIRSYSSIDEVGISSGLKTLADAKICIPMVYPVLLSLVNYGHASISLRLSVMVNLRVIVVVSDENCDRLLRIPAWQNGFFQLLEDENYRVKQLTENVNENKHKMQNKSKALIDSALRTLCDIQVSAVRIGKPLGSPYIVTNDRVAKGKETKKLLSKKVILSETKNGKRQLGVSVLRETMSFLRIREGGDLNVQLTGFNLLHTTVCALQREAEAIVNKRDLDRNQEAELSHLFQKIVQLNIWLVGAIILEFITVPSKPAGNSPTAAHSRGLVRTDSECSFDSIVSKVRAQSFFNDLCPLLPATEYDDMIGQLVDSLMKLIFPCGTDSENSWLSKDFLGFNLSGEEVFVNHHVLNTVSEGVNQIVSSSPSQQSGFINMSKSPMKKTAAGISWIMIRILFSSFAVGGSGQQGDNSSKFDKSIQALLQLRSVLSFFRKTEAGFFSFESLNMIGRLSSLLQMTTLSIDSDWVRAAIQLLMDLISEQRPTLLGLIHEMNTVGSPYDDSHNIIAMLKTYQSKGVKTYIDIESLRPSQFQDYIHLLEKYLKTDPKDVSISDVTIEAVKTSLNLSDKMDFDWRIWNYIFQPIIQEADRIADDAMKESLTEIGLHKFSEEVRIQLEQQRQEVLKASKVVERNSDNSYSRLMDRKYHEIWEIIKDRDNHDKRILKKWNDIVAMLANERGPWGFGSEDDRPIYWMISPTETNTRMRHVLIRNELGTQHQIASLIAQGKISTKQHDESELDEIKQKSIASSNSSQALWRSLQKYQKKAEITQDADKNDDGEYDNTDTESKELVDVGRVLFHGDVEVITVATNSTGHGSRGYLEVTKSRISFQKTNEGEVYTFENKSINTEFLWACQCFPSTLWTTNDIINILPRSYQLRPVAVEILFAQRTSVFIAFSTPQIALQFYNVIRRSVRPPNMLPHYGYKPTSIINKMTINPQSTTTLTNAWVNREISNFDYLMLLNTISGRSYNDLSQYPIFPWILADYTSSKLNLSDQRSFRDLKWPMGAQNENQREIFMEKYRDLNDAYREALINSERDGESADVLPPFHFGTHYSCMGFVLWYLIRIEPFTSLHIWMQDGKFDKADRLFDSIELAWKGCATNQNDVKELIPEFFYNCDFIENTNNVDFGTTQIGRQLGALKLPAWAKNPLDFIRQNRNALESEYVSANLHHWIDLIFGYKQRPPHLGGNQACVDACNVFFHLTYEGAVALDELRANDPALYDQIIRQISNFGQTPSQLFTKKHPQRKPLHKIDIFWPIASLIPGIDTIPKGEALPERPKRTVSFKEAQVSVLPILLIAELPFADKLITVDSTRVISSHFWQIRAPDMIPPYQFKVDPYGFKYSQTLATSGINSSSTPLSISNSSAKEKRCGVPFAPSQVLRSDFMYQTSSTLLDIPLNNKSRFELEENSRNQRKNPKERKNTESNSAPNPNPLIPGERTSVAVDTPRSRSSRSTATPTTEKKRDRESIQVKRVDPHLSNHLFGILPEHRLLFSCGHWDYSFKITHVDAGRVIQSISKHRDVVTCLALTSDFGYTWLVTGSRDCTVMIWSINPFNELPINSDPLEPLHVLYGHDDAVNCVAINCELNIVASGSDDGTIMISDLRRGVYIRSLQLSNQQIPMQISVDQSTDLQNGQPQQEKHPMHATLKQRIHWVGISLDGLLVAYSNDDNSLYSYSVNGCFLAKRYAGESLHAFKLSDDNKVLITGGDRGLIVMRLVHSLELTNYGSRYDFESVLDGSNPEFDQGPFNSPIRCIYLTKQERHLIVGLENGCLRLLAQDSDYLRRRLHSKLMEIGILEKLDGSI